MPQKATGEKLERVISTKISATKFELFEKYARDYYIQRKIKQPTVSVLLRGLINGWLAVRERTNEHNSTRANAATSKSFKPIEGLKYIKFESLASVIRTTKSSDTVDSED